MNYLGPVEEFLAIQLQQEISKFITTAWSWKIKIKCIHVCYMCMCSLGMSVCTYDFLRLGVEYVDFQL